MSSEEPTSFPPYAYVPGGPWPHPKRSAQGHSHGIVQEPTAPIDDDEWGSSRAYLRGVALFNEGYYWEAHEAWEGLWHAHNRRGPVAQVVQALIKLAAAGVKVREGQPAGVRTHALRASLLFEATRRESGTHLLGLDLQDWSQRAREVAENPPRNLELAGARVSRVFSFRLEPTRAS